MGEVSTSRKIWTVCRGLLFVATCSTALADVGTARFNVSASVASPETKCLSESVTQQRNALVKVICSTDQFVSIEAFLDNGYVAKNGKAFRHNISHCKNVSALCNTQSHAPGLNGTAEIVAASHIANIDEEDGLQILVYF